MAATKPTSSTEPQPHLASTVVSVVLRVAGPVITDVRPHALGTRQRQVVARIGDVLFYLDDRWLAARIRQQWDAAQYVVSQRLPEQAPQVWLAGADDSYPLTVAQQLTGDGLVRARYLPAHRETRTPPHVRLRLARFVFQVCDREAWRTIGEAWFAAQRYLEQ